jgi:chaperone required for assembly of F1-ATPase
MQRFWTAALVVPTAGGHGVMLDGKLVRLPGGGPLAAPTAALAAAMAAEWSAAPREFRFDDLPLTRLVGTAQERIAPDPAPVALAIAGYGGSDLLCYRAEDTRLAERQAAGWDPLLAWAATTLDATLRTTMGLMPITQPPAALAALARAVAARTPVELAALGIVVPALGSLVLGLAALTGRLDPTGAIALATLDERFQEEFWGTDAEAARRRVLIAAEVDGALRAAELARG